MTVDLDELIEKLKSTADALGRTYHQTAYWTGVAHGLQDAIMVAKRLAREAK